MACPICSAELECRQGPGRPQIYCGDGCRRVAEFRIRAVVRRIDKIEAELRELLSRAGRHDYLDEPERKRSRVRALRRWLKEDQGSLEALLGSNGARSGGGQPAAGAEEHVNPNGKAKGTA